jgi:hypothetical protein
MVQGNILGLAMYIFAVIFVAIGHFALKLPDVVVMSFAALVITAIDRAFRFFNKSEGNLQMGKESGGYLYFIPAWVLGIAAITINIINFLHIKNEKHRLKKNIYIDFIDPYLWGSQFRAG